MKKFFIIVWLILVVSFLLACSVVSEKEHQEALNRITELENRINEMNIEYSDLNKKLNTANADKKSALNNLNDAQDDIDELKSVLIKAYDGYRFMAIFVTSEVYGNGLSPSEWENYFVTAAKSVPTYEEIDSLAK